MNFDPYDSAAWRTFQMLDADEAALFDEATLHDPVLRNACLEMDRLAAAIAATIAVPLDATAEPLDRLQIRLELKAPHHSHFWLATTGWAAAAVLAILLTLHLTGIIDRMDAGAAASTNKSAPSPHATPVLAQAGDRPADPSALAPGKDADGKSPVKVETKRLHQEVEVLRDSLEQFQDRDRALFEVVPGMALPIVMTMNPPDVPLEESSLAKNDEHSPLTSLLGDALRTLTSATSSPDSSPPAPHSPDAGWLPKHPTAIPIYDAARDSGTLVVSNLPPTEDDEVYNLWVTTETGAHPIYVGSLPPNSASGADSFDFSLGSTMVIPSGFILTRDLQNAPANPTATNTILQGPPAPHR
jgi:hypothetical protein